MFATMLFTDTIRALAKRFAAFALSLVFVVGALPALAQQQPEQVPGRVMWGGPWGWHPFMIVGPIIVVLAIIGVMVIFVWLVRWATRGYPFYDQGLHYPGRGRTALDILDERFARGEIDKAEFEEKRKLIGR
jgi:putative membrane protein